MMYKVFPNLKNRSGEVASLLIFTIIYNITISFSRVPTLTYPILAIILMMHALLKFLVATVTLMLYTYPRYNIVKEFDEYLSYRSYEDIILWNTPYILLLWSLYLN